MPDQASRPPQPYTPAEALLCPLCGSTDVRAAIRDRAVTVKDLLAGPLHPLTYGLVAYCRTCELEWKPEG